MTAAGDRKKTARVTGGRERVHRLGADQDAAGDGVGSPVFLHPDFFLSGSEEHAA
jgi:hypothetical protein